MQTWKKIGAIGTAVVVLGGVFAAGAAARGQGGQPPATEDAGAGEPLVEANAEIGGPNASEDRFVPIQPCRIVDTRNGPSVSPGSVRTFDVAGSGATFAAQGGTAGGCGIPSRATAIEATVTAVGAPGGGYLRVWPGNTPAPSATFMNFTNGYNASNTGALAIDGCTGLCPVDWDLKVEAFSRRTHVVIDVNGYYIGPMRAKVASNGTLISGRRVTGTNAFGLDGTYQVTFDRDVSQCSYSATVDDDGGTGWATVAPRVSNAQAVYVKTFDHDGSVADQAFYLEVTC